MNIAAATSIQPSNRLSTPPSVVSITRLKRKVPPPPERMWAEYKPPPWWSVAVAFLVSVAIHIGAVAVLEADWDFSQFYAKISP